MKRENFSHKSQPSSSVPAPHLRRIVAQFYRTTLADYREAGCPFGLHVEGMLIWFEFGQATRPN